MEKKRKETNTETSNSKLIIVHLNLSKVGPLKNLTRGPGKMIYWETPVWNLLCLYFCTSIESFSASSPAPNFHHAPCSLWNVKQLKSMQMFFNISINLTANCTIREILNVALSIFKNTWLEMEQFYLCWSHRGEGIVCFFGGRLQ